MPDLEVRVRGLLSALSEEGVFMMVAKSYKCKKGKNMTHMVDMNIPTNSTSISGRIVDVIDFMKSIHYYFYGDLSIIREAAHNSIVGEAYYKALLYWNHGEGEMIPSNKCIWNHLRKLVVRYIEHGYVFDIEFIDELFN